MKAGLQRGSSHGRSTPARCPATGGGCIRTEGPRRSGTDRRGRRPSIDARGFCRHKGSSERRDRRGSLRRDAEKRLRVCSTRRRSVRTRPSVPVSVPEDGRRPGSSPEARAGYRQLDPVEGCSCWEDRGATGVDVAGRRIPVGSRRWRPGYYCRREIDAPAGSAAGTPENSNPPHRVRRIDNLGIIKGFQEHVKVFKRERNRSELWSSGTISE